MRGKRFSNPGLDEYLRGITCVDAQEIDEKGKLEEAILLGTRMTRGISISDITERFGFGAVERLEHSAKRLQGLVKIENGRLSLTSEGFLLHSAIVSELVQAMEGDAGA